VAVTLVDLAVVMLVDLAVVTPADLAAVDTAAASVAAVMAAAVVTGKFSWFSRMGPVCIGRRAFLLWCKPSARGG
jgi:hypothetical protein